MNLGPYEVQRQISEGSFGRTFYAVHRKLGLPACLKQEKTGDPEYIRMFEEEARLLFEVRHSSLPVLRDYFETRDAGAVMVMSFIPGDDLARLVEKRGPIDDEHICWILQRTLDALSYLHYHGIVHSDVKPQNIILDIPRHNAVLVDFGLFIANPSAVTKAKGGTKFFAPPEFAQGRPPLPASDLFSLGVTAMYLAGGHVPTKTVPPDMDPRLADILQRMTRRDPLSRPQDARDLSHEITRVRQSIYGRTHTNEEFKLRGVHP